jgi:hypothetical protein
MLSQILMVIALAVLAYMIWITMNGSEFFTNAKQSNNVEKSLHSNNSNEIDQDNDVDYEKDQFKNNVDSESEQFKNVRGYQDKLNSAKMIIPEKVESNVIEPIPLPTNKPLKDWSPMNKNAPVNRTSVNEINYASVPSSFVGSLPSGEKKNEDVNDIYVEGTDLLAAPLADRFYYTNSISNVNRNASNDLRGDIATPYNDNFTPFYQSTIYGEPLTVNRLGDCA